MSEHGIPITSWCYAHRKGTRTFYRFFSREERDKWLAISPNRIAVPVGSLDHKQLLHQETMIHRDWQMLPLEMRIRIKDGVL